MAQRSQWALIGGVVALLGGALWFATTQVGAEARPLAVGADAPGFSAVRVAGGAPGMRTLSDYRGKVILLNVWATWCGPCRAEMPSIQALHQAYAARGLAVVAVSVDQEGQEAAIADFGKEYGLDFELLHDAVGAIQQIYQTAGVPESFVIARDGTIRKRWMGAEDWNSPANRSLVEQLLAEPAP
jgi:peroxiredoxin